MKLKEFAEYVKNLPEEAQEQEFLIYVDQLVADGTPLYVSINEVQACCGRDGTDKSGERILAGVEAVNTTLGATNANLLEEIHKNTSLKDRLDAGRVVAKELMKQAIHEISMAWRVGPESEPMSDCTFFVANPYNESCHRPAQTHEVIRKIYDSMSAENYGGTNIIVANEETAVNNPPYGGNGDLLSICNCIATVDRGLQVMHPYLTHEVVRVVRKEQKRFPMFKTYIVFVRPNEPVLQPTNKE